MKWDDLVGIAWKEGGRTRSEGFDCYGVVLAGLERLGIPMLDVWEGRRAAYARGWRHYEEAVPEGWQWLDDVGSEFHVGDILVTRDQGIPRHLGLVVRSRNQLRVLTAFEETGTALVPLTVGTRWLEGIVRVA